MCQTSNIFDCFLQRTRGCPWVSLLVYRGPDITHRNYPVQPLEHWEVWPHRRENLNQHSDQCLYIMRQLSDRNLPPEFSPVLQHCIRPLPSQPLEGNDPIYQDPEDLIRGLPDDSDTEAPIQPRKRRRRDPKNP